MKTYPYLVTAWFLLARIVESPSHLPEGPLRLFGLIEYFKQHPDETDFALFRNLPQTSYVLRSEGELYSLLNKMDLAYACFARYRKRYPMKTEGMDVYSNLLYIMQKEPELLLLADSLKTIKSPESMVALGNALSCQSHHEKAIQAFTQAISLNGEKYYSSSSYWILLGHEYMEIKNLQKACQCYRSALVCHPRDYRAQYSLSLLYEMEGDLRLAVLHGMKALGLRPKDSRVAIHVSNLIDPSEGLLLLERSLEHDPENHALYLALGKKHEAHKNTLSASNLYMKLLSMMDPETSLGPDYHDVALFLIEQGRHEYREWLLRSNPSSAVQNRLQTLL